jgi:hypothetical protein
MKINLRYLPKRLTRKDRKQQSKQLMQSRRLYKKGIYHSRPKVASFKSKKSSHIMKAEKIYHVKKIGATNELAKATGCSKKALAKIINKGAGAYFSSGSRPNQTAQSWGVARLASSITAGKAAAVDYKILEEGCKPNSKALTLAKRAKRKHGHGTRRVPKVKIYKGGERDTFAANSFAEIINFIKHTTIDSNIENEECGTIKINHQESPEFINGKYTVKMHERERGATEGRHYCYYEYYDTIIWHSHPKVSKFYPSLEDILKIIKLNNKKIKYSYIFTGFGFWTLKSINHIDVDTISPKQINDLLDRLYFGTNKGREYVEESVNRFIADLNSLLRGIIEIRFDKYTL